MSKKTLLNEATVRKFMKFANIGGLSEAFIDEEYGEASADEEPSLEEGGYYAEQEPGMEPMDADTDAPDLDVGAEDIADEPVDVADEPVGEELPPEAVAALEQAVEAAADAMFAALAPFGVEGEASVEEPADLADEPIDMADEPEFPDDEGPEDEVLDEIDMLDEEAVVNETVNRVIKRLALMKESKKAKDKKSKMIDSVADAIVARLRTKK